MKKFLLFFFILSGLLFAGDKPNPTSDFFVNDFANVMTEQTKQNILSLAADLYTKTQAQIVVVTIPSLDGEVVDDYALDLLRRWKIGDAKNNRGALLLVAVNDRKSRVEVGYGLEGILPDGKTGRMQDELMIPYFKAGQYSAGIENMFLGMATEVYKGLGIEVPANVQQVQVPKQQKKEMSTFKVFLLMLSIFGFLFVDFFFFHGAITRFLFIMFLLRGGRGGGGGGGGFSGGGGSGGGGGSSRGW